MTMTAATKACVPNSTSLWSRLDASFARPPIVSRQRYSRVADAKAVARHGVPGDTPSGGGCAIIVVCLAVKPSGGYSAPTASQCKSVVVAVSTVAARRVALGGLIGVRGGVAILVDGARRGALEVLHNGMDVQIATAQEPCRGASTRASFKDLTRWLGLRR